MAVTPSFDDIVALSLRDPERFWGDASNAVDWYEPWSRVLDDSRAPFYRWFAGGVMNTCHNALDRHVDSGRGEQVALIYDSPVTDTVARYSYRELRDAVARCAGVLRAQGLGRGDRAVIYMPMIPEAVIAMLACARLGAVHSVVFGGFAPKELASRIDDAKPAAVVSASCGVEGGRVIPYKPLLDQALAAAEHEVSRCIVLQRPQVAAELVPDRDVSWRDAVAAAEPHACVPVRAT
ncbi:MAG: AMP-binding protein, partial [Pseudomonadota bacterium]